MSLVRSPVGISGLVRPVVSTAGQLGDQLLAAFDRGAVVVIADMSATASCDGACVDAVASAFQQAAVRRAELRLVATAPAVRRLLAARGLDRLAAADD